MYIVQQQKPKLNGGKSSIQVKRTVNIASTTPPLALKPVLSVTVYFSK